MVQIMVPTAVQVVAQLVLPAQLIKVMFQPLLVAQELLSLLLVLLRARPVHRVDSEEVAQVETVTVLVVVVAGMEAVVVGMTQAVVVALDI